MKPTVRRWPFVLVAVELAIFAGSQQPWFEWERVGRTLNQIRILPFSHVPPGPRTPLALLVSDRESDRFSVRATLEPRGYSVLPVDTAAAGVDAMRRQRDRIAIVVIDTALPQTNRLLQAAGSQCPHAHLIRLNGSPRAGEVSALLIAAVPY